MKYYTEDELFYEMRSSGNTERSCRAKLIKKWKAANLHKSPPAPVEKYDSGSKYATEGDLEYVMFMKGISRTQALLDIRYIKLKIDNTPPKETHISGYELYSKLTGAWVLLETTLNDTTID